MKQHLIPSLPNLAITEQGQVYRFSGNKQKLLTNSLQGSKLIVNDGDKSYEVIYLMIEAFSIKMAPQDRIKFKINRKLMTIDIRSIKIKQIQDRSFFNSDDEYQKNLFGCSAKASHANARFTDKITPIEIFLILKTQDFRCYYCAKQLDEAKWQIDHFYSKFHGGKNVFGNIVACCEHCNRMKHTLNGHDFINRCKKVFKNLEAALEKQKEFSKRKSKAPKKAGVPFTKEP